jgi:hypothetical protein
MLRVFKAQKALQECVGENQKETILTNLEKDAPSSLPCGSILAKKSYLRTLADLAKIPLQPALTNKKRQSKLKAQAPIKLVDGPSWRPGVYRALRLLGNTLEVAWERVFIRTSHF